MGTLIHSTAIIDPEADLAASVRVGAYAVIGPQVSVGEDTEIGAGAQIGGYTRIGEGNRVFPHACVGFEPQDLKYGGSETWLEVGDRNVFREFVTIHRGTEQGGALTTIGDDNLFMAYSHVAHDCHVGHRTIFSNAGTLAGHVEIQDDVTVGAFSAVHQFCRVGRHAYIGGYSVITRDALPWVKTVGQKPLCYGVNTIGLQRKGFDKPTINRLQAAMRVLLHSGLNTTHAVEKLREEYGGDADIDFLIDFIEGSDRGVITAIPGRRGGRGGSS